jgi:hypothetical protein
MIKMHAVEIATEKLGKNGKFALNYPCFPHFAPPQRPARRKSRLGQVSNSTGVNRVGIGQTGAATFRPIRRSA